MQERDVVSGMAVFVAIVEGGSLAAAARQTGLSPSAVSKLVGRLERSFGLPLLNRTTRSMTLTEAGQIFFDRARAVLDDLRSVEQEMASNGREPRGLLRITASLLMGQLRVVPILLAFMKKMPGISLDLMLTDRVVDLVGERVDVAVRMTPAPPPDFVARRVGTIQRVLCASPGYLRGRSVPRRARDLAEHNCLMLSGPTSSEEWRLGTGVSGAAPESVRVSGRLRVTNTQSLHQAAVAGLGIADLPRYLVAEDLRAGRLVSLLEPYELSERGVYVIYPAGPHLPVRVREVAKYLVRELDKVLR